LLSGGTIFTEFESAIADKLTDNRINIDKTDIATKKKVILFKL
jgi:hypothetical protein